MAVSFCTYKSYFAIKTVAFYVFVANNNMIFLMQEEDSCLPTVILFPNRANLHIDESGTYSVLRVWVGSGI